MHPVISTLFMVRDKDLRKWGRLTAAFMTIIGLFLIGAAIYSNSFVPKLEESLLTHRILDEKMIEKISDEKLREAFYVSLESNREIDQNIIEIARAFIFVSIGVSILCFSTAVLLWRSYELASSMEKETLNPNN
jgi:hypothetical protein